jgi:hypothetical protein
VVFDHDLQDGIAENVLQDQRPARMYSRILEGFQVVE